MMSKVQIYIFESVYFYIKKYSTFIISFLGGGVGSISCWGLIINIVHLSGVPFSPELDPFLSTHAAKSGRAEELGYL